MKNKMTNKTLSVVAVVATLVLAGCAGQPQQLVVQQPDEQKPQTITFPNGTVLGGASANQASTLAQLVVDSSNNNMKDYEQLQGTASKNLQTSQQALGMLEKMSEQQGTGQITLFFPTGSASLPSSGFQYDRLVNFLDYLSRDSRGLGGRQPRTIRTELSERNRTGAFARGHATGHPGTLHGRRRTRSVYDRSCGLRPTESLSGFLSRGGR